MPTQPNRDPFLSDKIRTLHDTPMQRKFRQLAPMPIGCVFIEWPGMTDDEIRGHFRLMKKLGFTCLKQIMHTPDTPAEKILNMALDEGIIPFWYAEGGWEPITPELLTRLGLPADLDVDDAMAHPAMLAHQTSVIRQRIDRKRKTRIDSGGKRRNKEESDPNFVPGVVGDVDGSSLHPDAVPHFIKWLQQTYGDVVTLKKAWNLDHSGISGKAWGWQSWDDVRAGLSTDVPVREYRHLRDIMKFRAETYIRTHILPIVEQRNAEEPHEPLRAGGEMGLFLPFASRGTDMEGIALAMAEGGSFYPSIHLAWHFEEVAFEVARPVYMQAQIAHDWAKGIWSATWESTGGPQFFSGGKSPFVEEMRNVIPGFTVDPGCMTQLMLSYLAAGFKGFGLWCWNPRSTGWEAGEYALLDRNSKPTERAVRVGQVGQAAVRWRRELWEADKQPLVGILADWENEAIWACMSHAGRDRYKSEPIRARIGASRAFINANVPWEYVTPRNLAAGLGGRYRCIYLPAMLAISRELQGLLEAYVRQGGRLVIDMPGAYYDDHARLLNTGTGHWFERVFGVELRDYWYNNNVRFALDGLPTEGFTAELSPTRAVTLARFDGTRHPAVTLAHTDAGQAVVLAFQASGMCLKPGHAAAEAALVRHTLGDLASPYRCANALVYRLASERADHYFLINDGAARTARLTTAFSYHGFIDAVTGQPVDPALIDLEAHSGRWLRAAK